MSERLRLVEVTKGEPITQVVIQRIASGPYENSKGFKDFQVVKVAGKQAFSLWGERLGKDFGPEVEIDNQTGTVRLTRGEQVVGKRGELGNQKEYDFFVLLDGDSIEVKEGSWLEVYDRVDDFHAEASLTITKRRPTEVKLRGKTVVRF